MIRFYWSLIRFDVTENESQKKTNRISHIYSSYTLYTHTNTNTFFFHRICVLFCVWHYLRAHVTHIWIHAYKLIVKTDVDESFLFFSMKKHNDKVRLSWFHVDFLWENFTRGFWLYHGPHCRFALNTSQTQLNLSFCN